MKDLYMKKSGSYTKLYKRFKGVQNYSEKEFVSFLKDYADLVDEETYIFFDGEWVKCNIYDLDTLQEFLVTENSEVYVINVANYFPVNEKATLPVNYNYIQNLIDKVLEENNTL